MQTKYSKEEILDVLANHVADLQFIKKDGTLRKMKCTRNLLKYAPKEFEKEREKETSGRAVNPDLVHVYDLDSLGWRSFIFQNLQSFEINECL